MEASTIKAQYGGGQYWQKDYDPYDALTLDDAHEKVPDDLQQLIDENKAVPILIRQGINLSEWKNSKCNVERNKDRIKMF